MWTNLSYHSYVKEGNFNWKAFVDGYQECYRTIVWFPPNVDCAIARSISIAAWSNLDPELSKAYDVPNSVITNGGDRWCRHFIERRCSTPRSPYEAIKRDGSCTVSPFGNFNGFVKLRSDMRWLQFCYMYPGASLNCYSKGWYLIRVSPLSAGRTNVECEYYKHKDATVDEMEEFLRFGKQVQHEVHSSRWSSNDRTLKFVNNFILIWRQACIPAAFCIRRVKRESTSISVLSARTSIPITSLRNMWERGFIPLEGKSFSPAAAMMLSVRNRQFVLPSRRVANFLGNFGFFWCLPTF